MDRDYIEDNLHLVIKHYDEVITRLEEKRTRAAERRKVSRRLVVDLYVLTHDQKQIATATNVSVACVNRILARAVFRARRLSGLPPA